MRRQTDGRWPLKFIEGLDEDKIEAWIRIIERPSGELFGIRKIRIIQVRAR